MNVGDILATVLPVIFAVLGSVFHVTTRLTRIETRQQDVLERIQRMERQADARDARNETRRRTGR